MHNQTKPEPIAPDPSAFSAGAPRPSAAPRPLCALVLDGHARAAVETVQALGRSGVAVDVAAEQPGAMALFSRHARRRLTQPSAADPAALTRWLAAAVAEADCRLIVPATEASLLALRTLPEDDPVRLRAVLPGNDALDTALNKDRTVALARRLDVPAPEGRLLPQGEPPGPAAAYPAVLKPVRSKLIMQGRMVTLAPVIVRDAAERARRLAQWLPLTDVIEQTYAAGHGFGIELLYAHGVECFHFAHERLHEMPLTGGGSTYRRAIAAPPRMLAAARRLLDALGWHGAAMVEFRGRGDEEFMLMEINPRLWGSLALSIDAGVNFPLGLWRLALGQSPGAQPRVDVGYATRYLPGDVEWFKANLRADHHDPLLLTRPHLASLLELLRPLAGRESWDHFEWRDPRLLLRLLRQTFKAFY